MRVLFVCLGNICRSPTAEAVLRGLVAARGLDGRVEVDSAGTGGWHVGDPPDPRAVEAAAVRGVELSGAARQVETSDFERFDLLIAMDRSNVEALRRLAPSEEDRSKVRLLGEFGEGGREVPDPYYGGPEGFAEVVEMVERCCEALLVEIGSSSHA